MWTTARHCLCICSSSFFSCSYDPKNHQMMCIQLANMHCSVVLYNFNIVWNKWSNEYRVVWTFNVSESWFVTVSVQKKYTSQALEHLTFKVIRSLIGLLDSWPQFHEWGPWCQQPHPESPTSLRLMACDTLGPLGLGNITTGHTNLAWERRSHCCVLMPFKHRILRCLSALLSGVTSGCGGPPMACAHYSPLACWAAHQGAPSPAFLLSPGDDGGPIESQPHYC